jgi:hypothetical protein
MIFSVVEIYIVSHATKFLVPAECKGFPGPNTDQSFVEPGPNGLSKLEKDNIGCVLGNIHADIVTLWNIGKELPPDSKSMGDS